MADLVLTETEIDNKANEFIEEFCRNNKAETSKIIAGMVAVINGNERTLEKMKNQKWFERIWFTISGKNKATVAEMQRNRDVLNKYLVQIVTKIAKMVEINSVQAAEMSSAIIALDDELHEMKIDIHNIAMALNDKIKHLSNYMEITIDIQNDRYSADKPLISLIDIASKLDSLTVSNTKQLQQLKNTMKKAGFRFDEQVRVQDYAEQVFSLPEEDVGRILLFCRSLSNNSRFLAYTADLIENYFYLGETDRREARESGEVVEEALRTSGLRKESVCVVDEMYTDLKDNAPNIFSALSAMAAAAPEPEQLNVKVIPESKPEKVHRDVRCIVLGSIGCGKGTLLRSILKSEGLCKQTIKIEDIELKRYISEDEIIAFYDTPELKLGNNSDMIGIAKTLAGRKSVNTLFYCVDCNGNRFLDAEADIINEFCNINRNLKVYVILTFCQGPKLEKTRELIEYIHSKLKNIRHKVIPISVKEQEVGDIIIPPYGVQELIDEVFYE